MDKLLDQCIINENILLLKFSGKGGWTYAEIPVSVQKRNNPFGWVKVKGSIDHVELKQYKLMPMGNGRLFLPVKAAIRKILNKSAGDFVNIVLYYDDTATEISEEIMTCFEHEPQSTLDFFLKLSDSNQKAYIEWISSVKSEEIKVVRIVEMMKRLSNKLGFYDNT